MLAAFLITLREGLEAFLLVGILLAFLRKLDALHYAKWIYVGVAGGVVASLAAAFLFQVVIDQFSNAAYQTMMMIGILLFAAAVLTYMAIWMQKQARAQTESVKRKLEGFVTAGNLFGMISLAFVAVLREGVETVLFFSALMYSGAEVSLEAGLIGAALGLAVSIALVWMLLKSTRKIALQPFFRYTSLLIIIIAAGLLGSAVNMLQSVELVSVMTDHLFDISFILDDRGLIGTFLRALFGYNSSPTQLQFLCWALYLALAVTLWHRGYQQPKAS
ncbi:FTR1 family iron permease [Insolitispirillum peregrinum]|uniref:High-affinity iron transporter n=1 Tax=Insolitispirillum peregrinum TaxID=80876 RepID=A0A1N7Q4J8_9PROT|nr:FTR1 family protein [Insolitispirillum peregrinum]SIT17639.1 high-affinity iron transporter [Insolitispirillum peregrinum]